MAEGETPYRGPFDGGYISFYVVLNFNLVLTLFCQDIEQRARRSDAYKKGKAKKLSNSDYTDRARRKDFADETSFRITMKSLRHAHARGIITTNEQQDKRKGINKNSHSCIKHPTRR